MNHHCNVASRIQPPALHHARVYFPDIKEALGEYDHEFVSPDHPVDYVRRLREVTLNMVLFGDSSAEIDIKELVDCKNGACVHQVAILAIAVEGAAWETTPKSTAVLTITDKNHKKTHVNHRTLVPDEKGSYVSIPGLRIPLGMDSSTVETKELLFLADHEILSASLLERQRCLVRVLRDPLSFDLFDEHGLRDTVPNLLAFYMNVRKLNMGNADPIASNNDANKQKVAQKLEAEKSVFSPWSNYALDTTDALVVTLAKGTGSLPSRAGIKLRIVYLVL